MTTTPAVVHFSTSALATVKATWSSVIPFTAYWTCTESAEKEAAPGAIAAGVDQLLVCHTAALQHRAIDLVRGAAESGRIPAARLAEAKARVARLLRFAGPPPDPYTASARLRTAENLALAARVPALAVGKDPTARA